MMLEYSAFEHLSKDLMHGNLATISTKAKEHHYPKSNAVAFIPVHGILTKRASLFDDLLGMTSYDALQESILIAATNPNVETIILDIDSPGGEISGLFDLCDFIVKLREEKNIIALVNESAFSAGYAIASCANEILLNQTAGVGSIGVIATHVDQSSYDAKQGLQYTSVYAGQHKNDLNPHTPITEDAKSNLQLEVDRLYGLFTQLVSRNRNLKAEQILGTQAGCFFGQEAINIGLADKLISFAEWIPKMTSLTQTKRKYAMAEETIDIAALEGKAKLEGKHAYRESILELCRLCKLAKVPHKLSEFIEQDVRPDAARDFLLSHLAEQQPQDIVSIHAPKQGETTNPLVDIASKRAENNRRSV